MSEKNKAIIEAIKNELSKYNSSTQVEFLVRFNNHGNIEHGILNYLDNVIDAMSKNGLEFKTE